MFAGADHLTPARHAVLLRDILPKNLPAIAAALACINPDTIVDLISPMEAAARTMQFAQERADKEDEGS
jgi:hypothetical protein